MKLKEIYDEVVTRLPFLQNPWFLALVIITTASIGRLSYLTLVEFKGDEALNLFLATRPLFGHPFPSASLASSVGILNFPLLNYFLFPITLISYYPPFVSGIIGLLNVLAIGGYFLFITKYVNKLTGFLSALFFALAPWPILYGRKIWAQDFLIPLVIALLFCFFKIHKEKKQIFWMFYGILSLFLLQIHQTAGILPILLCIPLIRKQRPHFVLLLLGIALGLLPTIPYVWYEVTNRCPDCTTFFLLHTKLQQYHLDIFLRAFQIITPNYFHTVFGDIDNLTFTTIYPLANKLSKVFYLMYFLLPAAGVLFWIKQKAYRSFVFIIVISLFVFFLLKIQPEMHYLIIFTPFLFLIVGNFLSEIIMHKNILVRFCGIVLCALCIISYGIFDYSFFHFLSIKKGFGGDYGGTYLLAAESATKDLKMYRRTSGYQEMVLAYYIPKESIQGDMPMGQVLYPLSDLQPQIAHINRVLENEKSHPDPRIVNEVLAYYTYPGNETIANIFFLKQQSKNLFSYKEIYNASLNDYLYRNHRHYFSNGVIWIEFPEHWKETTTDTTLHLSDENVSLTLSSEERKLPQLTSTQQWQTSLIKIAGEQTTRYDCFEQQIWCGSYLPSFEINGKIYSLTLLTQTKNISTQHIENERKVLNSVIQSLTAVVY